MGDLGVHRKVNSLDEEERKIFLKSHALHSGCECAVVARRRRDNKVTMGSFTVSQNFIGVPCQAAAHKQPAHEAYL